MKMNFKEEDLFYPIKNFFIKQGYKVSGEIKNCDIIVHKDNEIIVVELKKFFTMKLLYQAIERKSISNNIYIAIPQLNRNQKKNLKNIIYILKSLNIGLIIVNINSNIDKVNIVLEPNFKIKKICSKLQKNIIDEIKGRKIDINKGGVSKVKINTAYREKSIHIACIMKTFGSITSVQLVKEFGFEKNVGNILRNNYYNWYTKEKRGVYFLSEQGKNEITEDKFKEVAEFYLNNLYINKK